MGDASLRDRAGARLPVLCETRRTVRNERLPMSIDWAVGEDNTIVRLLAGQSREA